MCERRLSRSAAQSESTQNVNPLVNNSLVVGAPKITEDVVSGVHMRLTRVLYVLAQFRWMSLRNDIADSTFGANFAMCC